MNADLDLETALLLFKGAPLSILAMLFALERPAGVQEIRRTTHWGHGAVEDGLQLLAKMGLTQRLAYRGGWSLTSQARQLSFFGGSLAAQRQVTGGGGLTVLSKESISIPPLLSLAAQRQLDISEPLVQALLSMGGAPLAIATNAIDRALGEHGLSPDEIARRIAVCAAYCASPSGKGLKWPGSWAAGIIGAGYEPPEPSTRVESDDLSRFDGYLSTDERNLSTSFPQSCLET